MKNNYIILMAIIIIFNPCQLLLPHNEFTGLVNGVIVKGYIVQDTTIINSNVIKWSSSNATNLQIYSNNLLQDNNFPIDELNTFYSGPDAVAAFNDAATKWNEAAPQQAIFLSTNVQSSTNSIIIKFSATPTDFDNMSIYAKTHLSTDAGGSWVVAGSYTVFNVCDGRYDPEINSTPWKWTDQSQLLPYDSTGWVDWESVCLHELGHVLGLAECAITDAVMYEKLGTDATRTDLTKYDYAGLHYMWRLIFQGPGNYPISTLPNILSTGSKISKNTGVIK
jgi:hypothetical protein